MRIRFLLSLCLGSLTACLFAESLSVIRTERFDVIYPESAAESAALVASRAESYADEICSLLNTRMESRLPVYIREGVSELNAWYSPYPFAHIVLLDAVPSEGELAGNSDSLLAVFYHELTHAVSLSIRTPFWHFVASVVGDFVSVNSAITMPLSFIEGAAVSFESLGGEGRLQDPAALHLLVQDKLEGNFPSWKEAAGPLDLYPAGRTYYLYGGFFASWLQDNFGLEKYADFWRRGASLNLLTSYTQSRFRQTYGMSLDEAWARFEASIPQPTLIAGGSEPLPGAGEGIQSCLDARGGRLAWVDLDRGAIMLRDRDGAVRRLADADGTVGRLSLSADGNELLVSRKVRSGSQVYDVAEVFDASAGTRLDETYPGLRDAAFLDGSRSVVAVRTRSQRSYLVLLTRGEAEERVLLEAGPGTERELLLSPVDTGTGDIAFLSVTGRRRDVLLVNKAGGSPRDTLLSGRFPSIRYLARGDRGGESVLTFGWATPGTLYRAARWEPSSGRIEAQWADVSGGAYYPVEGGLGTGLVYVARYSGKTGVMVLGPSLLREASPLAESGTGAASGRTPESPPRIALDVSPFTPLPWLLKGVFLPLPVKAPKDVSEATGNILPGFLYVTGSPTEASLYSLKSAFSAEPFFVDYELNGSWSAGKGTLEGEVADHLRPYPSGGSAYRDLSANAGFTRVFPLYPSWNRISASLSVSVHGYGRENAVEGGLYGEPIESLSAGMDGTFQWQAVRRSQIARFPILAVTETGPFLAVNGWLGSQFPEGSRTALLQGVAGVRLPLVPLSLSLAGMYAPSFQVGPVTTRVDAESARDFEAGVLRYVERFPEYAGTDRDVVGTEAAWSFNGEAFPLTLEIQRGVPLLPLYANRLILSGGYRAGWFAVPGESPLFVDSGYGRVTLQGAIVMGALSAVVLTFQADYSQALRAPASHFGVTFASSFSL